jgi:hypothetical protein
MSSMKNGLILAGLLGALLCGAAVWLLLGRSGAPAPAGAGTSALESAAKPAEPPGARPSAKLQVEPAAQSEPAAAAPAPEPAQPAAEPRRGGPTPRAAEFLPYPNAGESDFKLKYGGLDLAALAKAKAALQLQLNEEQARIAEERFALGLYEERILDPHNPSAPLKPVQPPQGLGEVLDSQKTELQPDGTLKNKTTFLTQGENPEFFAHVAELKYLSNSWKQAGGH